MKKVSVVIPAYNSSELIGETLSSVLAQDHPVFEVIVVDDGSTDMTAAVVAQFPTVKYLRKENGGTASARNVGIREALGDYIAFVDSDDLWVPEKLRQQMDLIEQTGVEWVYSDAYAFDSITGKRLYSFGKYYGKLYDGNVLTKLFTNCFIPSPTPVISRKVFDHVGMFNESGDVINREDWEMWIRIARQYPVQFVGRPLAMYRVHENSKTGSHSALKTLKETLKVIDISMTLETDRLKRFKNKSIAHANNGAGCALLVQGEQKEARKLFARSIFLNPFGINSYYYLAASFISKSILGVILSIRRRLKYGKCTATLK